MQRAMFQLEGQKAKLTSLNGRAELHGDEHVPAADIKFSLKMSNDVLSFFDPALKGALYAKRTEEPMQGDMVGGISDAPVLRFPELGSLAWNWTGAGYKLTVAYGIGSPIVLDADIDNFRFECEDGGTVEIRFRAQAKPEEGQFGKLWTLIQSEVEITLDPPQAEGQPTTNKDLVDELKSTPIEDAPKKRSRSKAREAAEGAFD